MRYLFGDCALDTDRRELHRGTEVVPVEPQVFDLLVYLIRNRERVVSKDDLLASVWHGRVVSESALNTRISAARFAIGDNGEDQRLIRTLPRKGIRFVGAIREGQEHADVVLGQPPVAAEVEHADAAVRETPPTVPPAAREDGLAARPPGGSQEIPIHVGAWHSVLHAFQAPRLRMWGVAVAALLCVALGAAYLIGRPPAPVPPKPHLTFRDCDVCPEMVALPTGEFMMGSAGDEADRLQFEGPPRRVVITRPFAIGRFEITVDEFTAFVAATATTTNNPFSPCFVNFIA